MPRRGHTVGPPGCPPELQHYEQRFNVRLSASKLTKQKGMLARSDSAVAEHFRRRIREPARFDAFMAGRSSFQSDTPCRACGSSARTTYTASCYACQLRRRPLHLTAAGKVASWPPALRSRAGWLALCDARRREGSGERESCTFGPFTVTTTPTGKLAIDAPGLGVHIPDLSRHPFDFIHNIVQRHPDLLEVLRWAGWT